MRRAVLATRAAISPRLAIRIFRNTGWFLFFLLRALLWLRLRHPGRGALLEEGAHALFAFVGCAGAGDAIGLRRGETLGGEEIAVRGALAHRGEDVGTDGRGGQSEAHFGHAEFGVGGSDGDIAGGGEPHASRKRGA